MGRELAHEHWEPMPASDLEADPIGDRTAALFKLLREVLIKRGVGGFRAKQYQATGANGGTGLRLYEQRLQCADWYRNEKQRMCRSTKSAGSIAHGYDGTTNYAKGQGATTTIDTQNQGDYTVDWQKVKNQ